MIRYRYRPDNVKLYMVQAVQASIKLVQGQYLDVFSVGASVSVVVNYMYITARQDCIDQMLGGIAVPVERTGDGTDLMDDA